MNFLIISEATGPTISNIEATEKTASTSKSVATSQPKSAGKAVQKLKLRPSENCLGDTSALLKPWSYAYFRVEEADF